MSKINLMGLMILIIPVALLYGLPVGLIFKKPVLYSPLAFVAKTLHEYGCEPNVYFTMSFYGIVFLWLLIGSLLLTLRK